MLSPAALPETLVRSDQAARHLVISIGTPLEEVEDRLIDETLRYTKGDKTLAAKLLGIATRTIYRRMKTDAEVEPEPPDRYAPVGPSPLKP